jgi:hypothetical protein
MLEIKNTQGTQKGPYGNKYFFYSYNIHIYIFYLYIYVFSYPPGMEKLQGRVISILRARHLAKIIKYLRTEGIKKLLNNSLFTLILADFHTKQR